MYSSTNMINHLPLIKFMPRPAAAGAQVLCHQKGGTGGRWVGLLAECCAHAASVTWRELLDLAVKEPWLAPSGPFPALIAQTGLENTTFTC